MDRYYLKNFSTALGIGVVLLILASIYPGEGNSREGAYLIIALAAIVLLARQVAESFKRPERKDSPHV